jgi:hypothetical protein
MLVFVHMHKTAGTTVSHILRSSHGLAHCQVEPWHDRWQGEPFSAHDLRRVRRLYPNLKSIAGHRVMAYPDLQESATQLKYLTLMRDPLKLCASRFQYKVNVSKKKDLDFEEWIQQDWPRDHQTKWIAGVVDVDKAIRILHEKNIFVGLTERFDESMVLLKGLLASDLDISYRRVNVARDKSLAQSLLANERTRGMLIESQKADMELYQYVKGEYYPAFRQEYGPSLDEDVAHYQQTRRNTFNHVNLTLCRLKHYMLYAPLLYLNRKGAQLAWLDREISVPVGVD